MDSDISHAAEERFAAIEARLDALDGGVDEPGDPEEQEEGEPPEEPVVTHRRGGRRKVVEEPEVAVEPWTIEGA